MNIFKNFIGTFKAVRPSDEFYLDDSGKHIIFRNMNGKTVPIQVTAEEYAEWLEQQGVTIDPADQTQLHEIDKELEFLERAAEFGPGLQKQYEDYFKQRREQYAAVAQQYYQQALQLQGQKRGVTPEKLHEDRKQAYKDTKKDSVRREELPDRGWHSYAERYIDRVMEVDGVTKDNKRGAWDTMKVFQMVLMQGADLAKSGISPTEITLDQMLKSHSDDAVSTYFQDVMGKHSNGPQDMSTLSGAFNGLKTLKQIMSTNSQSAAPMREAFDYIYRRAYDDFNKEEISSFGQYEVPSFSDKITRESIPTELPAAFNQNEAQALFGFFGNSKQKVTAANRVTLHSLARLYDLVPEKDRAVVASELSDGSKGLHAIHQTEFLGVYQRKMSLGLSISVEDEIEGILRLAAKAAKAGTTEELSGAMKEIAGKLGRIDGIHAFTMMGEEAPSHRNFSRQWKDASINAGRRKGEGPDLIAQLIDDESRKSAVFNNRTLKLLHKPETRETKNLEVPPAIQKTAPKEKPQMETHGFTKQKVGEKAYEFVSSEGYRVLPGKDSWKVLNPQGSEVGEVYISPGAKAQESISKALYEARQLITENTSDGVEEKPKAKEFPFKEPISEEDEGNLILLTDRLREAGLQIKPKVPGLVFEVSNSQGVSGSILRAKTNGKVFMSFGGKSEPLEPEAFMQRFSPVVETPQPTPVVEDKPPEAPNILEPSRKPTEPIKIKNGRVLKPKKEPKIKKPAEPMPYDEEEWGPKFAPTTGKPMLGYARWALANLGNTAPSQKELNEMLRNLDNRMHKKSVDDGFLIEDSELELP